MNVVYAKRCSCVEKPSHACAGWGRKSQSERVSVVELGKRKQLRFIVILALAKCIFRHRSSIECRRNEGNKLSQIRLTIDLQNNDLRFHIRLFIEKKSNHKVRMPSKRKRQSASSEILYKNKKQKTNNAHGKSTHSCTYEGCNYIAKRKEHLTRHLLVHTGVKPYTCDFVGCKYTCSRQDVLLLHTRRHTASKAVLSRKTKHLCSYEGCNYIAKRKAHLTRHLQVHIGEKPYKCDFPGCQYTCTRSDMLIVHKRRHTGIKPFVCDFDNCNYACIESGAMIIHKRRHSGEKPFICEFEGCHYASVNSSSLIIHMRRHTGDKPFICDFPDCDYACVESGALTVHKRQHSQEDKPYKCDFPDCNYASHQRSNLKHHKRNHTGNKPFVCDFNECYYACTTSGSLTKHKRCHTGERPYVCNFPNCEYASTQVSNLIRHKQIHDENYVASIVGCSKIACEFIDQLEKELKMDIVHRHCDRIQAQWTGTEYKIPQTQWKADGFTSTDKCIYEFHGDDIHGHPRFWTKNKENRNRFGQLHKELHDSTMVRMQRLQSLGYKIIWIWECDFIAWKKQCGTSLLRWPELHTLPPI
jgi:uncharacterized Zn-finger protein/G:T-mismatch repair DNA endonuclease (very short patch repair protein)